jgi:hypothetical protein
MGLFDTLTGYVRHDQVPFVLVRLVPNADGSAEIDLKCEKCGAKYHRHCVGGPKGQDYWIGQFAKVHWIEHN